MKIFAIRVQPDTRTTISDRYVEYPTPKEYERIWDNGSQNGFHECVNFRNFDKKIKGYMPPSKVKPSLDEPFVLIYVTSKAKNKESISCGLYDRIIGIQAGCQRIKPQKRTDVPPRLQNYIKENDGDPLTYEYEAPYELSILLKNPIENASEIIFPKKSPNSHPWGNLAIREIKDNLSNVIDTIDLNIHQSQWPLWAKIKEHMGFRTFKKIRLATNTPFETYSGETIEEKADDLFEGKEINILVNRFERDATAKSLMIDYYNSNEIDQKNGYKCQICGFDFEEAYGDLGRFFIEAHHLVPLSKIKKNHAVNPKEDLVPLCANCHAMIHKMKEPNYKALRDLYQEQCRKRNRLDLAVKASNVFSVHDPDYIASHLKSLYKMYKNEPDREKRFPIIKEIKKWIQHLPKDLKKTPSLKEILRDFS